MKRIFITFLFVAIVCQINGQTPDTSKLSTKEINKSNSQHSIPLVGGMVRVVIPLMNTKMSEGFDVPGLILNAIPNTKFLVRIVGTLSADQRNGPPQWNFSGWLHVNENKTGAVSKQYGQVYNSSWTVPFDHYIIGEVPADGILEIHWKNTNCRVWPDIVVQAEFLNDSRIFYVDYLPKTP